MRGLAGLALAVIAAGALAAQEPRPQPREQAVPLPSLTDTVPTSELGELVIWSEADSVMQSLLARAGYTITRYQGDTVRFDADTRALRVEGNAAVGRGETVLVGDTLIYNDVARTVLAIGDTVVLRDPTQQDADIVAFGRMSYDLERQRARVINVTTAVEAGERWFLSSREGLFIGDRTGAGHTVSYGLDGSVTSCDLDEPHYHFRAREIKHVGRRWIIARPAILYIEDVPVAWLPFVFQDIRSGRRSGVLNARFGLTDVVRTSGGYRRQIENVGYYFALNDYMDAQMSLDWRSGVRGTSFDPGWTRYNGEFQYRWMDRFLSGRMGSSYTRRDDGSTNLALSLNHTQSFSQTRGLNANINYVTNTRIQRDQSFNVQQALATISSSVNYRQQIGPAAISLGGARTQFPGRDQVNQTLPTLNISTSPISPAEWLVWSPSFTLTNSEQLRIDQPTSPFRFRYVTGPGGALDSIPVRANARSTNLAFDTPLQIAGFTWRNRFTVSDVLQDFPIQERVVDPQDPTQQLTRVYQRGFSTRVDWETGISLPSLSQGRWNLSPSVSIQNVDPGSGFWLRTHLSGGQFVSQSKRLVYSVSSSPTFFGLLPGFGPFARIRHAISPSVSFAYSPAASVSDEFLSALGRERGTYLGALAQNRISLGLSHNFEARLRSAADTGAATGEKIRLLSMNLSSLTYDFERARATGRTLSGFATETFGFSARSDLLPGFDVSMGYSLFEGSLLSDTARFSPYRTTINASFSIGRDQNPITSLARLFRSAVPADSATIPAASQGGRGATPVGGTSDTRTPVGGRFGQGWTATLSFTSSRSRPARGANVFEFDPGLYCLGLNLDPIQLRQCQDAQRALIADTLPTTTVGGQFVRMPPMSTLQAAFGFNLTPHWSVQWSTGYDFQRADFSDHFVTLVRQMHDWRANFAFMQAPNGNFAFSFFISLIAQPELKFDYRQRSYRPEN
jgi:hypothetical protein